jgi:hypothetical protein
VASLSSFDPAARAAATLRTALSTETEQICGDAGTVEGPASGQHSARIAAYAASSYPPSSDHSFIPSVTPRPSPAMTMRVLSRPAPFTASASAQMKSTSDGASAKLSGDRAFCKHAPTLVGGFAGAVDDTSGGGAEATGWATEGTPGVTAADGATGDGSVGDAGGSTGAEGAEPAPFAAVGVGSGAAGARSARYAITTTAAAPPAATSARGELRLVSRGRTSACVSSFWELGSGSGLGRGGGLERWRAILGGTMRGGRFDSGAGLSPGSVSRSSSSGCDGAVPRAGAARGGGGRLERSIFRGGRSTSSHGSASDSAGGVVLYRNGVGYFERAGQVEGDLLSIRVRKDQVNDLLKSLTIVERSTGRAVSVSMPLDPRTWANAALAKLAPGRGSLHEVLDALRGADVSLSTTSGGASGRIVMVERLERASEAGGGVVLKDGGGGSDEIDYKVTLLEDGDFRVVRLSQVQSVSIKDGDLALQFHRSLDASAGEGMFQQVDVAIRLHGNSHDLAVSYVVAAPMWKPTYRIVLPEAGKGKALLQGWAVVDNTSGEDWRDVKLSLTSGSPIAFRYDLHTPRDIYRDDLSSLGGMKRARAAVGETCSIASRPRSRPPCRRRPPRSRPATTTAARIKTRRAATRSPRARPAPRKTRRKTPPSASRPQPARPPSPWAGMAGSRRRPRPRLPPPPPPPPSISVDTLAKSALANTKARAVSGLVQFDLQDKVTVPDGTSTMVAVVNQTVEGEETYLFKPGGAGVGFEQNPYRVIRFKNTTPFVLEPGPISIYAGGSFVGEGLSETVGTGVSATIPFAVEPNLFVSTNVDWGGNETRLVKIVRGVIEIETFSRRTTTYELRAQKRDSALTVLVRHTRAGTAYQLEPRPEGTEDLA